MIAGRRLAWLLVAVAAFGCAAFAAGCRRAAPPPVVPLVVPWNQDPVLEGALLEHQRELIAETEAWLLESEEDPGWFGGPELEAYLSSVLGRIRRDESGGEEAFRVRVVPKGTINGAALPDRVVVLNAGLLAVLESEAELAFILAHELVHLIEHHAALRAEYRERTPSHVLRMRFSRTLEDRADEAAFTMMEAAGYPPSVGVTALGRLELGERATGPRVRGWESHRHTHSRIRVARAKWGDSRELEADQGAFGEAIDPVRLEAVELLLDEGEANLARSVVDRHLARNPGDGRGFYLRSRIIREGDRSHDAIVAQMADLERAIELHPEEADSLRTLGLLLARGESPERGVELLERYLRLRPEADDRPLVEREISRFETPTRAP